MDDDRNAHRHRAMSPELMRSVQRPPAIRFIQVVEVRFLRGEGCCDQDPAREVSAFYFTNGQLLMERDSFEPPTPEEPAADGS